ncbi:MAG: hypothetical protein WBD36_05410 [Bacteroidota bacterium]
MVHFNEYWKAVSARVCAKCIDGDSNGYCRLGEGRECGLTAHFPRIVETILSVESDSLEPYVSALRKNVCEKCKEQSADGTCAARKQVDCGLDRYFPMIVDVVQGVRVPLEGTPEAFGD